MKKFIYSALIMSAVMVTACKEDYINPLSDEPVTHNVLPEVASAGVYEGTWEVNQIDADYNPTAYVGTYAGQVNVETDASTSYVAKVTVSSSENTSIAASDRVNCFWSGDIIYLQNSSAANFGAAGIVLGTYDNGNLKLHYFQTMKVGRKSVATMLQFTGKKK